MLAYCNSHPFIYLSFGDKAKGIHNNRNDKHLSHVTQSCDHLDPNIIIIALIISNVTIVIIINTIISVQHRLFGMGGKQEKGHFQKYITFWIARGDCQPNVYINLF